MSVEDATTELGNEIRDRIFGIDADAETLAEICRSLIGELEILAEGFDADADAGAERSDDQ